MKKMLFLTALGLAAMAGTGFAQNTSTAGDFGYGLELTGTGAGATNDATATLYALDNGGTTRLPPTGSSATLAQSSWTASSNDTTALASMFNLGTFTTGDTLILDGGSMLTYANSNDNFNTTTQYINYRVSQGTPNGSFAPGINLPLNQSSVNSTTGDTRWSTEAVDINLLNGLAPGVYTLDTYGYSNSVTTGDHYESNNQGNGALNFAAKFTVVAVPEPGTWALMVGGLGLLFAVQRVRRNSR